jgi:hypothetical protein
MWPTDGKATNGFENKIRWSFFYSVGRFFYDSFPRAPKKLMTAG